jgi:methionyl-tRNA synthetase
MNDTPSRAPGAPTIEDLKARLYRPKKAVVTAGMPYASGPVHIGHMAGAHVPPDIFARWLRMLIGADNVLFVCGSDDHGSASELAAKKAGQSTKDFIATIHALQKETFARYQISFDVYSGTSRTETFEHHKELCQAFIRASSKQGMLHKKDSLQWFDPKLRVFLQDRFVTGHCPNPKCDNDSAYSDECEKCQSQHMPQDLKNPKSALSDAVPELKKTTHWWLDMWKVVDTLKAWIATKEKTWRQNVFAPTFDTVHPSLKFDNTHEELFKSLKSEFPPHKSRYTAGKKIMVLCESTDDLNRLRGVLEAKGVTTELVDDWAHRSISRDVAWGIPMPEDLDPDMKGKTFYVWPDSLVAPISFSKTALRSKGRSDQEVDLFWKDPDAKIYQFLGQDNVYFYTLMQGALWLSMQDSPHRQPQKGDYQMTEIFAVQHLMVEGEKMSKSKGNYYTGDQLILEMGYTADQLRYFLATLSLAEKSSNFDFGWLKERNKFLAGPMNAAFEKPISACHSKYFSKVPDGVLNEKVVAETTKLVQRYFKCMEKAEYALVLGAIENYARQINSMFTQFKPHDDRAPEKERHDALFTCFYILRQLVILLHPFVPETMERLRQSLRLPENIYAVDQLGLPIPAGHEIGPKVEFFPAVAEA